MRCQYSTPGELWEAQSLSKVGTVPREQQGKLLHEPNASLSLPVLCHQASVTSPENAGLPWLPTQGQNWFLPPFPSPGHSVAPPALSGSEVQGQLLAQSLAPNFGWAELQIMGGGPWPSSRQALGQLFGRSQQPELGCQISFAP